MDTWRWIALLLLIITGLYWISIWRELLGGTAHTLPEHLMSLSTFFVGVHMARALAFLWRLASLIFSFLCVMCIIRFAALYIDRLMFYVFTFRPCFCFILMYLNHPTADDSVIFCRCIRKQSDPYIQLFMCLITQLLIYMYISRLDNWTKFYINCMTSIIQNCECL